MTAAPFPSIPPGVRTVYLLGDVHGFGVDTDKIVRERFHAFGPNWELPADVAVVQVGDLLHKGPDGPWLVAQVDRAIKVNAGRWIQLWGNHETSVIHACPEFWSGPGFYPEPDDVVETLHRWWRDQIAHVAVVVPSVELGDVLVTHAGLSVGWWNQIGSPSDPHECATALNADLGGDPEGVFGRGRLLDDNGVNPVAGPIWSDTSAEGWAQWLELGDVPFSQVHGHAAPWSWNHQLWLRHTNDALRDAIHLDPVARRAHVELPSGLLISIDTQPVVGRGLPGDPVLELTIRH